MNASLFPELEAPSILPAGSTWAVKHGDCIDVLSRLPSASVDLAITDPAYESLEKHRAKGTTTRLKKSKASSNEWFPIFPNRRFPALFEQLFRVLKRDTHFYMFCDQETMFVAKPMAEAAGFRFWKPLVWSKVKEDNTPRIGMGYHFRASCEFILFFEKGKRRLSNLGTPDVLQFAPVRGAYPTEKPVPLSVVLVEQSSKPGDLVIDPFVGSGSVGWAALASGRRFWGCDISEDGVSAATTRLESCGVPA